MDKKQERKNLERLLKTVKETPEQRAERVREEGNRHITKVIPDKRDKKPKHKEHDYDER